MTIFHPCSLPKDGLKWLPAPGGAVRLCVILVLASLLWGCSSHKNSRGTATAVRVPEHVNVSAASTKPAKALLEEADKWLGTPYKYGGDKRGKGVDCSGLVNRVYADALSISLPRNSAAQADYCKSIDKNSLDIGDLVFFSPGGSGKISHVGMYIGDGFMIHASGSKGVMISSLSEPYYIRNYKSSGRVGEYEKLVALANPSKSPEAVQAKEGVDSRIPDIIRKEPIQPPSVTIKTKPKSGVQPDSLDTSARNRTEYLDNVIDQKVDSICSSFFE